jgi:hypothetical protein
MLLDENENAKMRESKMLGYLVEILKKQAENENAKTTENENEN